MAERLLQRGWESYLSKAVPKEAGAVQIEECRRAYYAGAGTLLGELAAGTTPGPEPTLKDAELLAGLAAEVLLFVAEMEAQKVWGSSAPPPGMKEA